KKVEGDWTVQAKEEVKKIKEEAKKSGISLTKEDDSTITAIQRSVAKPGFDCGIRVIHFADKDKFNGINNSAITGMFKMFSSGNLNGFKPAGGMTSLDYWWHDIGGKKAYKI